VIIGFCGGVLTLVLGISPIDFWTLGRPLLIVLFLGLVAPNASSGIKYSGSRLPFTAYEGISRFGTSRKNISESMP